MKKNKTILIVGACGTIGTSLVKELSLKEYDLLLGDINKKKLYELKKINPKNIEIFFKDLTLKKNIDKFISFGHKRFKKIDSIVFASYPKSKQWGKKFENIQEKYLKEDLYNQLGSTIIFCQRIGNYFIKQKYGNIILISSIQGLQAPKFEHYQQTNMFSPIEYSAIKSGIIAICRYLAKYYRNKNIRVNCVSPGGIKAKQPSIFIKKYRRSCNSKGLLESKDITQKIIFLISDHSNYITGHNLIVDDGWHL